MHNKTWHRMHVWVSSLTNCKQMRFYRINSNSVLSSQTLCTFFFPQHLCFSYFCPLLNHIGFCCSFESTEKTSLEPALVFLNHSSFLHFWFPIHTLLSPRQIFKSHFAFLQGLLYSSPTFFLCYCSLYGLSSVIQT